MLYNIIMDQHYQPAPLIEPTCQEMFHLEPEPQPITKPLTKPCTREKTKK
jgi:hypothetical protein